MKLKRTLTRQAILQVRKEGKHMQKALSKTSGLSEAQQNVFKRICRDLYYLKTDSERALYCISYAETIFNIGKDNWTKETAKKIELLEARATKSEAPRIELVGA